MEIETLNAQAEIEPLERMAAQLGGAEAQRAGSLAIVSAERADVALLASRKSLCGGELMNALIALGVTFVACFIAVPLLLGLGRTLGLLHHRP